jgi:hypothetical protein
MLKELGYKEGSLYARIDQAVSEHKLTSAMDDWAHEVRLTLRTRMSPMTAP